MSERVQVIFRWDKEKLERLKAWAALERLTLQEVLEALATKFLNSPDSKLITEDSRHLSTDSSLITGDNNKDLTDSNVIAEVIARLEQVEKTVNHLAPIQDRFAALESELGGVKRLRVEAESLKQKSEISVIAPNVPPTETPAKTYTQTDSETPTRKELGKLFNVSHEAIRIWEENGKLKELGWERIPSAGNPVRYRRVR